MGSVSELRAFVELGLQRLGPSCGGALRSNLLKENHSTSTPKEFREFEEEVVKKMEKQVAKESMLALKMRAASEVDKWPYRYWSLFGEEEGEESD
jgi:hypothetical protein